MEGFSSSAPCKAILFGEHYVVYGAPALSVAIEPRNTVEFSDGQKGAGESKIALHSIYGNGTISTGGRFSGPKEQELYAAVAKHVFGSSAMPSCSVKFSAAWNLKGVGTSASLCAAFAAGLYKLKGKKPSAGEIFASAQAGDLVAHGGRASGIDAKTVSEGGAIIFQRKFSSPSFDFVPAKLSLPKGTTLLLIDTFSGKKSATSEMISLFASSFGISRPPQELNDDKRAEMCEEYAAVWQQAQSALGRGSARELGAAMSENHALLKSRGVSSKGLELAVSAALSAGAHGAKLTAAGGEGGAVLVLCDKASASGTGKRIADATGFAAHAVSIAKKGACAD